MKDQDHLPDRRRYLIQAARSPAIRIAMALGAVVAAAIAAWAIWAGRDVWALLALLLIGSLASKAVSQMLPISAATRATWSRIESLEALYPSYRYRYFLWLGIAMVAGKLIFGRISQPLDVLAPLVLIVGGGIAALVWQLRHANRVGGV